MGAHLVMAQVRVVSAQVWVVSAQVLGLDEGWAMVPGLAPGSAPGLELVPEHNCNQRHSDTVSHHRRRWHHSLLMGNCRKTMHLPICSSSTCLEQETDLAQEKVWVLVLVMVLVMVLALALRNLPTQSKAPSSLYCRNQKNRPLDNHHNWNYHHIC